MAVSSLNIKRKNIDLPVETLQKLSIMAVAQGKSLKSYIEYVLINKAEAISVEVSEHPSPSKDEWFDDRENMAVFEKGRREHQEGKVKAFSMDEIRNALGL